MRFNFHYALQQLSFILHKLPYFLFTECMNVQNVCQGYFLTSQSLGPQSFPTPLALHRIKMTHLGTLAVCSPCFKTPKLMISKFSIFKEY